jgi:hypothetical protein
MFMLSLKQLQINQIEFCMDTLVSQVVTMKSMYWVPYLWLPIYLRDLGMTLNML